MVNETARAALYDYAGCLDPNTESLKMHVYLGRLIGSVKKVGLHIFNTLKVKKIHLQENYKDWTTAEKHVNLLY